MIQNRIVELNQNEIDLREMGMLTHIRKTFLKNSVQAGESMIDALHKMRLH